MRRKVAWLAMGVALTLPTPGLARRKKEAKKETNNIKDAIHHYEQGHRLFTLGKLVEAIEEYHAALKLDPDEAYWHRDLAEALMGKHDRQGATQEYDLASMYSPHDDGLRARYEELAGPKPDAELKGPNPLALLAMPKTPVSDGGDVVPPKGIEMPEPPYPEEARRAQLQGVTVLLVIVGIDGKASQVSVLKPLGFGLDQNAIDAVRTWKFKPAIKKGVPVPMRVTVEVTFRLFR